MIEYSNSQVAEAIDEWVHSERDRAILKRRLIDGLTYDQLADEFFLSIRQIKKIVYNESDRLFKYLK